MAHGATKHHHRQQHHPRNLGVVQRLKGAEIRFQDPDGGLLVTLQLLNPQPEGQIYTGYCNWQSEGVGYRPDSGSFLFDPVGQALEVRARHHKDKLGDFVNAYSSVRLPNPNKKSHVVLFHFNLRAEHGYAFRMIEDDNRHPEFIESHAQTTKWHWKVIHWGDQR
jgi:hypothetical protein